MIDFSKIEISSLTTHFVGNKLRDEGIKLSTSESFIQEESKDLLLRYFLHSFKSEEFYQFSHSVDIELNEIYNITSSIFASSNDFVQQSQSIAKLLYEYSLHPKVKASELNIVLFKNAIINNRVTEAIGIFKSEEKNSFLKILDSKNFYTITHDYGISIENLVKGCLIFNTDLATGYKILLVDNLNKNPEAQYWKDNFLQISAVANEYYQTKNYLSLTKKFIVNQLTGEIEISNADKIDLLNRSVEYFKKKDEFNKQEFEEEVFQDEALIDSFHKFDQTYKNNNSLELIDTFTISKQAVKKQAPSFKSVLKLDKNFHIYIHGNREMIEQGVDKDGRKYYKIYYEQEL